MTRAAGLELLHWAVPGRVRLAVPGLHKRPRAAQRLGEALAQLSGVHAARASPVTGTLLIEFDPTVQSLQELVRRVADQLGLSPAPAPADSQAPTPALDTAAPPPAPPQAAREQYRAAAAADVPEVLRRLEVPDRNGLLPAEAARRAARRKASAELRYRRSSWEILKDQFVSVPTAMLGAAMGLSYFTAGVTDTLVIGTVLLLNGLIGYATERYSEGAIEALRRLGYPQARVIRGGERLTVPAAQLVPGDVLRLRAGDLVPADARLIEGTLMVDEAMLTGESEPVGKHTDPTLAPQQIHEFENVVFQGTAVVEGHARAVVLTVGRDTELGRIQGLVSTAMPPRTQLQEQMDGLGKQLGLGAGAVSGGLFGVSVLRGQPPLQAGQTTVSLAVSAVPEGLPAVATTALAVGMSRMLRKRVIMRKLPAVEALGSVTVLCVDKTGTLTLNRMTASRYWWEGREFEYEAGDAPGNGHYRLNGRTADPRRYPAFDAMLRVGVLCNEANLHRERDRLSVGGSATEGALLLAAHSAGYWFKDLRQAHPLHRLHRRSEGHLRMASVHENGPEGILVAVKGQPDAVLELCAFRMNEAGRPVPLTEADRDRYRQANQRLADEGHRVLAFAQGYKPEEALDNGYLEGLTWLGLVGLSDPIRPGVAEAIRRCGGAGVRTIILTGDQLGTAAAVARALRLDHGHGEVLEAPDLHGMSPEEVARTVERVGIFARVTPEDKLRIVQALQAQGHVVAMTGDGINDGPALKAADIGVAMGDGSSDVARELADVVLIRNDFNAMVSAVEQGRVIFANIRRALRYLVATNVSELMLAASVLAAGLPFPFQPVQILWLNLVTDVFPALALVLEPKDRDVMRQPPRQPGTPILGRKDWRKLVEHAAVITTATLAVYFYGMRRHGYGLFTNALVLTTIALAQAFYSVACSGAAEEEGRGQHTLLWSAVGGTAALQVLPNHWAPLRRLLHGAPLGWVDYAVATTAAMLPALYASAGNWLSGRSLPGPRPLFARGATWQRAR